MVTFMYGFIPWKNIKPNPNTPTSISKKWLASSSLEAELNMTSCAMSKTSQKMAQIFFILNMFINKSSPKSTGSHSLGRLNGNVAMTQISKKCLNTKKNMSDNSNNKFTGTLSNPLNRKSSWVLDTWTTTLNFPSVSSVSCSTQQSFNMALQQSSFFYEARCTEWPSNSSFSLKESHINWFTTRCIQTATFLTGFRLWPWNLKVTKWQMICTYGRARSSQQSFTTGRGLNSMIIYSIGDCGTVGIMKDVISSY